MQFSANITRPQPGNFIFINQVIATYWRPICFFIFAIMCISLSSPALAQRYGADEYDREIDLDQGEYHESALRRFEVIFTVSIPFSALHSYLAVRGVEMARQEKVAPSMSRGDWNTVGALTFLFSGFIAFWDYMHTRDRDVQNLRAKPEDSVPSSISMSLPGMGYMSRPAPREPMLRLLSAKF